MYGTNVKFFLFQSVHVKRGRKRERESNYEIYCESYIKHAVFRDTLSDVSDKTKKVTSVSELGSSRKRILLVQQSP